METRGPRSSYDNSTSNIGSSTVDSPACHQHDVRPGVPVMVPMSHGGASTLGKSYYLTDSTVGLM